MHDATFLFTDIEGSTRLWEEQPERMRPALAAHDAMLREVVERHGGRVVKMTGDGVHAVFEDALDAVEATIALQGAVARLASECGIPLGVRCGLHAGPAEGRDGDFYGNTVNRAARVMSVAHGGQMLLSGAVEQRLDGRLPAGTVLRDLGSVRLRDLAQPERLLQLVHPALRSDFPALRSLENTPNNLPLELTSFIGREREIRALREMLAAHRMVSIVGLGGLGKTRLALQTAAELLAQFADGAWVIELAPLQDPARLPLAVASAWGLKEEAGVAIDETLARHARDRTMLLVLDNCEHLLEPSAALVRSLLGRAPKMRVLATSREPLRLLGEALFPLGGLGVPGPRAMLSPDAVEKYDSVQLFAARAKAASPGFQLDTASAETVAAICNRVDGIPLAIELAAARVRSVPLQEIAARLKDRFRLLTSGDTTATPRQRTLRATIDWSHDLLPPDERALFRRLAVFAGGWTLESAERVCASGELPAAEVLDVLGRLVEKSLAALVGGRYEMLETVREYAAQRLADSGEVEATGDAHLARFLDLARQAKMELAGPKQGEWLALIGAERENMISALGWARSRERHAESGLELVDGIKMYFARTGMLEVGRLANEEALRNPGAKARTLLRSTVLFNLGQFCYFMGRYSDARGALLESVSIARELGDGRILGRALATLAMAAIGEGDHREARVGLEEAIAVAEANADERAVFGAVNALAMLLRMDGNRRESRPMYERVVHLARNAGDRESEGIAELNLAILGAEDGDMDRAMESLRRAVDIAADSASAHAAKSALEVAAGIASARGDHAGAARMFGFAEAEAARTGARRDAADERFLAPRMRTTRDALGGAAYDAMMAEGARLSPERALDAARAWLGDPASVS